jgi:hypothetical protein
MLSYFLRRKSCTSKTTYYRQIVVHTMEDVKIHLYLNPFLSIYSLNGRACLQSNIVYSRCTVEEWCGCSVDRTTEHVNEQVRECTNEYSEEKEGSQSQVQSVFAVCVLADDECALCPSERVRWEQKIESEKIIKREMRIISNWTYFFFFELKLDLLLGASLASRIIASIAFPSRVLMLRQSHSHPRQSTVPHVDAPGQLLASDAQRIVWTGFRVRTLLGKSMTSVPPAASHQPCQTTWSV